jgi:hypothetical protein
MGFKAIYSASRFPLTNLPDGYWLAAKEPRR